MNKAYTVAEVNSYVKNLIAKDLVLSNIWIKGEISNFKRHSSGHCYLSLKDDNSVIKAVMFKYQAVSLKFEPENGMKVTVRCSVSVYTATGSYQLYVNSMQPDGIGALYLAYEQLKSKLEREGLFAIEFKKKLPRFPRAVGVITSPTGAAVRDIINVTGRRYPSAKIYIKNQLSFVN